MPIFFQQDIDESTKLAIWKIEEEESFFLDKVSLQREITHPHKRLQHLAGRYLLKFLFPDFPVELIQIADTRKPYLEDEAYHFSISHCGDYAAVIASTVNRVGVDVEMISQKIERIKHKFISDSEWSVLGDEGNVNSHHRTAIGKLTLIWSCKEAVFKWYGWGGVDFREHMKVHQIIRGNEKNLETVIVFQKNEAVFLHLHSWFFDELCLSYVCT